MLQQNSNSVRLIQVTPEELSSKISQSVSEELQKLIPAISALLKSTEKQYLTRKETAEMLNVSSPTLHNWEAQKKLIPERIGRRVLYSRASIEQALSDKSIKPGIKQ